MMRERCEGKKVGQKTRREDSTWESLTEMEGTENMNLKEMEYDAV